MSPSSDRELGTEALREIVRQALERVDAGEPEIAALVDEDDRRGRLEAEIVARRDRPGGPLDGLLVGVKDIFRVDGLATRAGSLLPPEVLAGAEAVSVTRLTAAGALVLGKTVTTEFAYFGPGPTRNPRNPAHTPGGSSSGSAAAVAAGYCRLALGTQTIGSINRPAAFCGVVGFKPSSERIPRDGVIPLSPNLDHVGVLADRLSTATAAAAVLLDGWQGTTPSDRPRLAIPTGPYLERASSEAMESFAAATETLRAAGYEVESIDVMPDFEAIEARHRTVVAFDAAEVHADWFPRYGERYHAKTAELIGAGRQIAHRTYDDARSGCQQLRRELGEAMGRHGVDLWVTPSAPGPAPRGISSTGDPVMNLPWTQAGLPTLTLPQTETDDGLPLALQFIAGWHRDEQLLAWGERLEELWSS